MKHVMWFSEIRKENIPEVGGKGANLGEMAANSFPIPGGFVITAAAYFEYIRANKIDAHIKETTDGLNVNKISDLNRASMSIKTKILSGVIPGDIRAKIIESYRLLSGQGRDVLVAVRSSATAEDLPEASFAGQQATFLNVQGDGEVVQAVKECWASLFEARAIYYRVENGFEHLKVGLAAVVQEMVQSDVAGVMFTVEPSTSDITLIDIEAAFGLGEIVVSGSTTPDRYLVRKSDWGFESKDVARQTWKISRGRGGNEKMNVRDELQEQQKLTDSQILELAKIGGAIERHYKKPMDTEWAVEGGKIYIVQARPVTTLKNFSQEKFDALYSPQKIQAPQPSTSAVQPSLSSAAASSTQAQTAQAQIAPASSAQSAIPLPAATEVRKMESVSSDKIILKGLGASPGVGKGKVRILPSPKEMDQMEQGEILVTDMTTPDFVPAMKKAAAIVTNTGGMTCHAAIVSRELGVPCVVGTREATTKLQNGQFITVDAVRGKVYDGDVAIDAPQKPEQGQGSTGGLYVPVTGTKIYVNLAEVELAQKVAQLPCDGVGLLRAEFIIAGIGEHPRKMMKEGREQEFIDRLADGLRIFASSFYPRPVVYRATDFKTNEYRNLKGGEEFEPVEANPMMGYRGCARYIAEPDVFALEIKAIKKVRDEFGMKNLWLMIPFVRRIGELRAVRDLLRAHGIHRTRDFKLWIMCEVPSTVFLIDDFCKEGIDGVSIGSNDLTQLTLGIDRDNSTLAEGFDERNPAVLKAIEQVVRTCAKNGVTCSLCGQAPSVYPEFAEKLVEFGITSMSVNPDAVERTRRIVASAEMKVLLKRMSALEEKLEHHSAPKTDED